MATNWYRSKWSYRKQFEITNSTNSSTLENYEVDLTFNHSTLVSAGKSLSDGTDLRFTDESGKVSIPFWIEKGIGTSSCTVWVKVPLVPANSTVNVYMYYGSALVESASDARSAFMFGADFEDWGNDGLADGEYPFGFTMQGTGDVFLDTQDGSRVLKKTTGSDPQGGRALVGYSMGGSYICDMRVKRTSLSGGLAVRFALGSNDATDSSVMDGYGFYISTFNNAGGDTYCIERRDNSVGTVLTNNTDGSWTINTWYRMRFVKNGTALTLTVMSDDGSVLKTLSTTSSTYSGDWDSFYFYVLGGSDFYVDEIKVRQYTSPEPGFNLGDEEERPEDANKYYGLAISNHGFDVNQTDTRNLSLISNFDTLRVFHTGTLKVVFPAGYYSDPEWGTWTRSDVWYFDEPLGYIPLVMPVSFGIWGEVSPCGPTGFEGCFFIPELIVDTEKIEYRVTLLGGDEMFSICWKPVETVFEYDYVIYRNPRFKGQSYAN